MIDIDKRMVKRGLVVKNTGSDYLVRSGRGSYQLCKAKGNFRIKGIKSTNPIAVGDRVLFDESGFITELLPRENYIVRKPTNLSKQLHIIAANVSQSLLVVTLKNPETSLEFIDRFLVTCEAYGVPAVLVINKVDLLDEDELKYLDALIYLYESIGYRCLKVSARSGVGITELQGLLGGKVSLLSGNSGVGKSTLINRLVPGNRAKTADISQVHHKGMHTTTFSEMYELGDDTFLIDTPGIKGFGMVNMERDEVSHYFPEIFALSSSCKFNNCSHRHEPGCAVLKGVEEHRISESRYNSYVSIVDDIDEGPYR